MPMPRNSQENDATPFTRLTHLTESSPKIIAASA